MKIDLLVALLNEKMGSSRSLSQDILKSCIYTAVNDLISEFKENISIVTYTTKDSERYIKIPNIAQIFKAKFDGADIPLYRLGQALNENSSSIKLIILDTQSVRLEPHSAGSLEIMASFYMDRSSEDIPLGEIYQRAILQGATCELYVFLDKPLEHIKSAKLILNDYKDELRTQINRAQEKNTILTRNIRI